MRVVTAEDRRRMFAPWPEVMREHYLEALLRSGRRIRPDDGPAVFQRMQIRAHGLVNCFFQSEFGRPGFLRQITDFPRYAARINALHELKVKGDQWETVPQAVRESDLVHDVPFLFYLSLVREERFEAMVHLGLVIGEHVPAALDNPDGIWPVRLNPRDGLYSYSGDLIERAVGGLVMDPVSGTPIPDAEPALDLSPKEVVEAHSTFNHAFSGARRVAFP